VHAARLLGGLARASLRAPLGSSTASPGVWGA
jgi:hypothetical protein